MEKGIPRVYYSGVEGEFNVMVMDMLGNFILVVIYFKAPVWKTYLSNRIESFP